MDNIGRWCPIGAASLMIVLVSFPAFPDERDPAVELASALEKREQRFRTAKFVWTEKRFYAQGAEVDSETGASWPPRDTTAESRWAIWIDGEKCRYEHQGRLRNTNTDELQESRLIATSNGIVTRSLISAPPHPPSGLIYKDSIWPEFDTDDVCPAVVSARPAYYFSHLDKDRQKRWSRKYSREVANKLDCILLEMERGPLLIAYWFAPTQDYSLVRYRSCRNEKTFIEINITNRKDKEHGWVPAKWTLDLYSALTGMVSCSMSANVSECAINTPLDPKAFEIVFPVGTNVHDEGTNTYYIEGR